MDFKGVTEAIVVKLREDIVTGEFKAGTRLSENKVAERLGISRPPLREALRRLENENLVVSIPRKGSFVAEMSVDDCEQINRARMMVECTAVDIIGMRNPDSLPAMRRSMEAVLSMDVPDASDDPRARKTMLAWFYALSDFHLRLVESSRNNWLVHCYQGLCSSLARYQVRYLNLPGSKKNSMEEHKNILILLENHEYGVARTELAAHLDQTRLRLISNMLDKGARSIGTPSQAPSRL